MAKKYIDADELLKEASKDGAYGYVSAEQIADFPAADVQEVKHGRWLMTDGYPHKVYCSECYATLIPNVEWFKTYNIASNYCPSCGSRMDLGGDTE